MKVEANNFTVEYPEIGFAFNPIAIKVTTNTETTAHIQVVGSSMSLERYTQDKTVLFDLSAVAKSLFDRSKFHIVEQQDTTLLKTLNISVKVGSETVAIPPINILWGALQYGETWRQNKNIKMFEGYPFTVPMYLTSGGMLQIQKDNGNFQNYLNVQAGKLNIDISAVNALRKISLLLDSGTSFSTFDITFDYTFRGVGVNSVMIDIEVVPTCNYKGVYLRWINKHGEYNYWLFRPKNDETKIEDSDIKFANQFTTVDFENHHHVGDTSILGKKIHDIKEVFSDFVSQEDFDFVKNVLESPVVDCLVSYENKVAKWLSVDIEAGAFPRTRQHLQDISFKIKFPKTFVQQL